MILWTIKLINTAKKAIAGRKYPHQLAWATAFGLLLGIVPHGNLTAVALLLVVLSLKINHAMVALTAIATSFLVAMHIDPYSHLLGQWLLTDGEVRPIAESLWQLPLVPWTDLNNTVVVGSAVIGIAALLPVFVITYPMFRLIAPKSDAELLDEPMPVSRSVSDPRTQTTPTHQVVMVDRGHQQPSSPHTNRGAGRSYDVETQEVSDTQVDETTGDKRVAVETRIDVIRMKGKQPTSSPTSDGSTETTSSNATTTTNDQPMDEALNYLLRQLRDSQQRSAA